MKYPTLNELNTSREMVDVFKGYNHNLRIGNGEFYDMTNLSSDNYPVLSTRPKRGVYSPGTEASAPRNPIGIIAKDALCYVDVNADGMTSTFYINGYPINFGGNNKLNAEPKTLISMGSYVIIMPDKMYVNTARNEENPDNPYEYGKIEASVTTEGIVTYTPCRLDGSEYEAVQSITAPEDPKNMDLWIDTSTEPHTLKQYSATNAMWTPIATSYIKITFQNYYDSQKIMDAFNEDDGVTMLNSALGNDMADAQGVIWKVGFDYIIITGILDKVRTQTTPLTIERKMPNMDFIIESGNRLWGCGYGVAENGAVVNEIYASKLGDFKNWNCFAGISTDSYVASVGTDGQFTGAITHLGYPIFFKENCMHKVYGNYPANYQIQTTTCRGVQKGSSKSLAIVNEVLYYKSLSAICAYDGSLPVEISAALGDVSYGNAVAGTLGNKYYISMQDANEQYHLFAYDTAKGMWHREDDTQAVDFCNCRGDLYYIDYAERKIKTMRGTGITDVETIKWSAVTGIIGTDSPDKKYISRMDVRMSLEVGTRVMFFAEYDSGGEWEHLFTMTGTKLGSFAVPIRPKRCDHFRLKIIGYGEAKIFSICKTIEQGSDV